LRGQATKLITVKSRGKNSDYHIPKELTGDLLKEYKEKMDWIVRYQKTFQKNRKAKTMAGDLRVFAELVDLKIKISDNKLPAIAEKFLAFNTFYFNNLAKSLFASVGKEPLNLVNAIEAQTKQSIPAERLFVTLVDSSPLNELDMAQDFGYQYTEDSYISYSKSFDNFSYKEKLKLLSEALKEGANASFRVEVIARPIEIHKLINSGVAKKLDKQPLSPYFGYDIEDKILDDTAVDMVEKCFDFSYQLYGSLQKTKYPSIAQLAILNGYRQRALLEIDMSGLQALFRLNAENTFYKELQEIASERFPLIYDLTTEV